MNWTNNTFGQISRDVLGKMGIATVFEGGAEPSFKFPRVSAFHGQPVLNFLDDLSRGLSADTGIGLRFTNNIGGDFVVVMGPIAGSDSVIEGQNMLIGRETIYNIAAAGNYPSVGQLPGTDDKWGAQVAHVPFANESRDSPFGQNFLPNVIANEMPAWDTTLLKGRARTESQLTASDQVTIIVTVRGWTRPSGGLWQRNQIVSVISPMLIATASDVLRAKSVTFTQDNRTGTRTTLELVNHLSQLPEAVS